MRTITCLLAIGIALPGTLALAGEKVEKTFAADPAGVVEITNVRGEIEVRGWDREEIKVEGELDDLAEGMDLERDGKLSRIEVNMPDSNIDSGDGSNLKIHVPVASRVEVRTVSSDTTVRDVGALSLKSVSGEIVVSGIAGEIALKSVSGDIRLDKSGGAAQLKSVSGDLVLELGSRDVTLGTVSGDVELKLGEFDRLLATTVSGDLELSGTLASGGRIEAKTVSGDLDLRLDGKVDARVSVRTGPGGEITNRLNDAKAQSEFPAQERLETTIGDGVGSITVSTVTGEVRLLRD